MSLQITTNEITNHLLSRLPRSEYRSLIASEEPIALVQGEEVYPQDVPAPLPYVLFPTNGMVSLTIALENGMEAEAATVGNEGMVGLQVALGVDFSPVRAITQIAGQGLLVPVRAFLKAMRLGGSLDPLMRRYTAYSLRYASQTAACNLIHSVEKRMCRWLLMCHDRVVEEEFFLTHEFLAGMLGVRRQTVSIIAGSLQTAGIISYHRGIVRVLDREKLQAASCECYEVIDAYYDRIMFGSTGLNKRAIE